MDVPLPHGRAYPSFRAILFLAFFYEKFDNFDGIVKLLNVAPERVQLSRGITGCCSGGGEEEN